MSAALPWQGIPQQSHPFISHTYRGMVLAIPLTQAAVGPFAAFHACVRETLIHAYTTHSRHSDAEPPSLAGGDRRDGFGPGRILECKSRRRYDQGRRVALALRHN